MGDDVRRNTYFSRKNNNIKITDEDDGMKKYLKDVRFGDFRRRLASEPAPSSRYSFIAIFVCAMVIILLAILCSSLLASAPEARLRAAKPRTPSYLEGYIQYRHDSLQRHELLI